VLRWVSLHSKLPLISIRTFTCHVEYVADQLWKRLCVVSPAAVSDWFGNTCVDDVTKQQWPVSHPEFIQLDTATVVLQVDGNLLGTVELPTADVADKYSMESAILSSELYKVRCLQVFPNTDNLLSRWDVPLGCPADQSGC
jgi:hypothetical protein